MLEAMSRPTRASLTGVLCVLPLVVAGCTGVSPEGGDARDPGTLLISGDSGTPTFNRDFNPYNPSGRKGAFYIYEPLMTVNNVTGETTPFLATELEQPDEQTVIFHLRPDATWNDGEAFTADDVVFTFNLLKEYPALDLNGAWQRLDDVRADGDDTIVMELNRPEVPAAKVLAKTVIVPQHRWAEIEDPVGYAVEEPVGTGPYSLEEFGPTQYSLSKEPDYWQAEKVAANRIVFPATNTALDLVNNGYDWAYSFMNNVDETWDSAVPGNTHWFPPGGTISLLPNHTVEPFDDVNVRRGISLALDRERLADVAEQGYVDAAGQNGLLLPYQEDLLDPDLPNEGLVEQDGEAAIAAFSEAGFSQSSDGQMLTPEGEPFSITLTVPNTYSDWLRGAQEVQRQLGSIGIDVSLTQPQPAAYQQALQTGDFTLAVGSFGGTGSNYQDMNQLLSSDFYVEPGDGRASSNFSRFQDDEVDDYLTTYANALSDQEQAQASRQLQEVMYDQVPVISMFYGGLWGLYSNSRFTGWPSEEDPYTSPITFDSSVLPIVTSIERVED